jgi:hypothetical protein
MNGAVPPLPICLYNVLMKNMVCRWILIKEMNVSGHFLLPWCVRVAELISWCCTKYMCACKLREYLWASWLERWCSCFVFRSISVSTSRITDCPDDGFSWFFSAPPRQLWGCNFNLDHRRFLSQTFQFTIHWQNIFGITDRC